MSYILEALKKSEKERKRDAIPDLQTHHTLYPGARTSHSRRKLRQTYRLRWGVTLLAAAATVIFFWKWLPAPLPLQVHIGLNAPPPAVQSETAPAPEHSKHVPQASQQGSEPIATLPVEPAAEKTTPPASAQEEEIPAEGNLEMPEAIVATTKVNLPFMAELAPEVRQQLPELMFAGHTYSDTPEQRMIIINNTIRRENDLLAPNLRLEEIIWDGVILNYQGKRFQIDTSR